MKLGRRIGSTKELELSCLSLVLNASSKGKDLFFYVFLFFEIIYRSNSAVSDPTSTRGRSGFCRQIHRPGTFVLWRGDIAISDPTSIGGRSGFCHQIHRPSRSDRAPSSFGEVILSSAIQLLSGDDRAFFVRSTALVGAIGHLRRLERWYCRQRSNFYRGTIGLLPSDSSFGEMEKKRWSCTVVVLSRLQHIRNETELKVSLKLPMYPL
ncbi:hypothetical protein E6C27_scaffold538G00080 [Cucumis melo var. makuwa]|uniref:Uncharacterized protein n=1 Tax=Cucumis melo var. makuwa TaxID=1194695 RepID=A0A5A7VJK1_CUCMM|nr:hypothetical protein E6C27_scaffold538G00080 [Cucumis melo var. makuwa]